MACVYWIHLPGHKDVSSEGYVGFTTQALKRRLRCHKTNHRIQSYVISEAIRKYGWDTLIVDEVFVGSMQECLAKERELRPRPYIGWNIAVGGEATQIGRPQTEEHRRKISAALKGIPRTPEWRRNSSLAHRGLKQKPHVVELMRARMTGTRLSEELKRKISIKAMGHRRNVGRPLSEAHKKRISESRTGKCSEALLLANRRTGAALRGTKLPLEVLQKIRRAKSQVLECPHCYTLGKAGGMQRHHMANCASSLLWTTWGSAFYTSEIANAA